VHGKNKTISKLRITEENLPHWRSFPKAELLQRGYTPLFIVFLPKKGTSEGNKPCHRHTIPKNSQETNPAIDTPFLRTVEKQV
jgi:hypothetical protein